MKKIAEIVFMILLLILFTGSARLANTIRVPADQNTIQGGVDVSVDGDTVLIADGTYKGLGNREIDLGGKSIVVWSENGPESTIIDGEQDGRIFDIISGEGPGTLVEGLTIYNGYAYRSYGGGIRCKDSSPTVVNCIIKNNVAWKSGGGIYCGNCSLTVSDCLILNNSGSGVACSRSSMDLNDCVIRGNSSGWGGGISSYQSQLRITDCIISNNSAGYADEYAEAYGGGIDCDSVSLANCIISENSVWAGIWYGFAFGGGISCHSADITNCTFFGNEAWGGLWYGEDGGGIYCREEVNINNCILWDDRPNELCGYETVDIRVTYSDIEGAWDGIGNIDSDPLFRDPENDDYHLMATYCGDSLDSPCIDAGDPLIFDDVLDCWHGLGFARWSDMGAYGGKNSGWPTVVEEEEGGDASMPTDFVLYQNYPNPFNAETVLRYRLSHSGRVMLSVYNVLGQRVAILIDDVKEAGEKSVLWKASDYSSGIYFARLEIGGSAKMVKMILLR
jgi:predicted outer membrane repeat protein